MRLFRCQHFHTTVRALGVINIDHFPHYIPSLAERLLSFLYSTILLLIFH